MSFNEWYERVGKASFEYNGSYTLCDLKEAWNAAIDCAEEIVDDRYDFQEPWLEPGEIRAALKG